MNCLDDTTISAYVDGELALEDLKAAAAHIESCADCQARYQRVKCVDEGMRRMFAAMPVRAARIPTADTRRRAAALTRPLTVAAAAAVIVAAVTAGLWLANHATTTAVVAEPPVKESSAEPAPMQIAAPKEAPAPVEEPPVAMPPFDAQSLASLSPAEYLKMRAALRQWARPAADTLPEWKVEQYRRVLLYSRAIMPVDNG